MSLFGKKEKEELEKLRAQINPELLRSVDLKAEIEQLQEQLNSMKKELSQAKNALDRARTELIETDEAVLMQSFGLYTPHYHYTSSDQYKAKLVEVRDSQKAAIKNGTAVTGNTGWQVNGSAAKGKKMVSDMQKLLLRAYNAECDDAIEHVRFNNIESCEKKISASADAISKLGNMMGISVTPYYTNLKLAELRLMYEYQVIKQNEKDAAKEARARQREEAKAAKELEEAKRKLEKEQSHYENALSRINEQLAAATDPTLIADLTAKKADVEKQLSTIDAEIKDVDYRAANQRAGYIYVISNIGAFGENVFKIGMTRRLDPMERIDELGDASVPFNFDVHAMIFTEDAPRLEAALHNAFSNKKLNYINQRREFFNVSLDEIKDVIHQNYDKTVEFVDVAPAEQYRETLKMKMQSS